jgi:hypothetical protein
LGAAGEDFEATGCVPGEGGVAEFVVLEEFDGDVAEGIVGKIAGDVGVAGGEESGLAVLQFDGDGIFALDGVDDFGGAEGDVDVVVAVAVQEGVGVRRDIDGEDADLIVGEDEVVVGLGGDLDFGGELGGEEGGQEQEEEAASHGGDCSSRAVASGRLPVAGCQLPVASGARQAKSCRPREKGPG